jgi:hypothetical protein
VLRPCFAASSAGGSTSNALDAWQWIAVIADPGAVCGRERAVKLVLRTFSIARLFLVEICGRGKLKTGVEPGAEDFLHSPRARKHWKYWKSCGSLEAGIAACHGKSARGSNAELPLFLSGRKRDYSSSAPQQN